MTDITWYEASAYAAFRGKQLPSIFQWEKASRNGFMAPAGILTLPWGVFRPGDPLEARYRAVMFIGAGFPASYR